MYCAAYFTIRPYNARGLATYCPARFTILPSNAKGLLNTLPALPFVLTVGRCVALRPQKP